MMKRRCATCAARHRPNLRFYIKDLVAASWRGWRFLCCSGSDRLWRLFPLPRCFLPRFFCSPLLRVVARLLFLFLRKVGPLSHPVVSLVPFFPPSCRRISVGGPLFPGLHRLFFLGLCYSLNHHRNTFRYSSETRWLQYVHPP